MLCCFVAYIAGSIPCGYLLTRWKKLPNIQQEGSGNIGTTNVLRTGGKALAIGTLALDIAKGFLPLYAMANTLPSPQWLYLVGLFSVLGHIFPIWLKFKGGKGVATYLGVMFALSLALALSSSLVWISCAAWSRRASVASLALGFNPVIFSVAYHNDIIEMLAFLLLAIPICFTHRENIQRLFHGTEPKIGQKVR